MVQAEVPFIEEEDVRGPAQSIVDAMDLNDASAFPIANTPCEGFLAIDEHRKLALGTLSNPPSRRSTELSSWSLTYRHSNGNLTGLILQPTVDSTLDVDICVDATFACGWGTEEGTSPNSRIQFKAAVNEDNQGALILAKLESGTHTIICSKFYALKLHWF
eukprot:jgi/Psemu1/2293/gm1.2293_g